MSGESDPTGGPPSPASIAWPDGRTRTAGPPSLVPAAARAAQARALRQVVPAPPPPSLDPFLPKEPRTWEEIGVDPSVVEQLLLRHLLDVGVASGRELSQAVGLPHAFVREVVDILKNQKLLTHRATSAVGDYVSELSEAGRARAFEARNQTTYVGPAPVPWEQYLVSLSAQSLDRRAPTQADLVAAFADLLVSDDLLDRLGPAITSGRPLFLHGDPGNGKTSIAERLTRCFGDAIWIPHTLLVGGHHIPLYDRMVHEAAPPPAGGERVDRRWIRVKRPTVVAGGELTMAALELQLDPTTRLLAPSIALKASGGTLLIDDFGRGAVSTRALLNRWIVPLEKRIDFLRLPDGRTLEVPFACLLVFSTNLEPRELADEAFLRRIPYKIHIGDPTESEFETLTHRMAEALGVTLGPRSVQYLIDRHYRLPQRAMRFCQPRDLLQQVRHLCRYEDRPCVATPAEWDRVVQNYFGWNG